MFEITPIKICLCLQFILAYYQISSFFKDPSKSNFITGGIRNGFVGIFLLLLILFNFKNAVFGVFSVNIGVQVWDEYVCDTTKTSITKNNGLIKEKFF